MCIWDVQWSVTCKYNGSCYPFSVKVLFFYSRVLVTFNAWNSLSSQVSILQSWFHIIFLFSSLVSYFFERSSICIIAQPKLRPSSDLSLLWRRRTLRDMKPVLVEIANKAVDALLIGSTQSKWILELFKERANMMERKSSGQIRMVMPREK